MKLYGIIGKPLDQATVAHAAEEAMKPAHPMRDNAFKVDLSKAILRSTQMKLA